LGGASNRSGRSLRSKPETKWCPGTLQTLDGNGGSDTVFTLYEEMMRQFFVGRALIPPGNIAEVRFDDLERDPLGEMRRLYQELSCMLVSLRLPARASQRPRCSLFCRKPRKK
jgi:Sulfotransferase family